MLEELPCWYWNKHQWYCSKKQKKSILNSKTRVPNTESKSQNSQPRKLASISELHKKYKTMNSTNLHELFKETPALWEEYHSISERNEEEFKEQDELPYRRIIKY